jgi:hypothetical protein
MMNQTSPFDGQLSVSFPSYEDISGLTLTIYESFRSENRPKMVRPLDNTTN